MIYFFSECVISFGLYLCVYVWQLLCGYVSSCLTLVPSLIQRVYGKHRNILSTFKGRYNKHIFHPIVKNFININLFVSFQNLFGFSVASVVGEVCVCLLRADTPLAPRYKSPVHATAILIVEAMPISIYFLWSVCGYVDVEIPRNLLVSDFFFSISRIYLRIGNHSRQVSTLDSVKIF